MMDRGTANAATGGDLRDVYAVSEVVTVSGAMTGMTVTVGEDDIETPMGDWASGD